MIGGIEVVVVIYIDIVVVYIDIGWLVFLFIVEWSIGEDIGFVDVFGLNGIEYDGVLLGMCKFDVFDVVVMEVCVGFYC